MKEMYDYALKLINENHAYVCSCSQEVMRDLRHKGEDCWCRHRSKDENLKDWDLMLNKKVKEGEKTLRIKIDMTALNHVMRDPVIFTICLTKHYRHGNKYSVWPTYDFYNVIEDDMIGVNYILKSNEFGTMRTELQNHIRKIFNFPIPNEFQYGRININDKVSQGREIRELIKEGKVNGWDDPRLITLKALKRRGKVRETFYELAKEVGLTPTETNLDFSVVAAINRKILDKDCNRYFILFNAEKVRIENAPAVKVELALHPEDEKRGFRTFETDGYFYISNDDLKDLKVEGKVHRLMDCLNFTYKKGEFVFHSLDYESYKNSKNKGKIINYLPVGGNLVDCEIMMDDASVISAIGEVGIKKLKVDDKIQAERMGFLRLDA